MHAFHTAWITHLSETLNGGVLPDGYYAMPEHHAGRGIADVLTLQMPATPMPQSSDGRPVDAGGVAVADAPPRVRQKLTTSQSACTARRTLAIRHISGHKIIALLEIISPANKDRASHVTEFTDKTESALVHGVHVLLADLFPPVPFDRSGVHGAIWDRFADEPTTALDDEPLTLASYLAGPPPEAYLERLAVGRPLPAMPLFLNPDGYVSIPLEATYMQAFRGLTVVRRQLLE